MAQSDLSDNLQQARAAFMAQVKDAKSSASGMRSTAKALREMATEIEHSAKHLDDLADNQVAPGDKPAHGADGERVKLRK